MSKIVNGNQLAYLGLGRRLISKYRNTGSIRGFRSVNSHCNIFYIFHCKND